ncbi:MAG: hypothetical protein AAF567_07455 [Actinomycetota bacterium]
MHPIERLRYVARASHVPPKYLVRETAMALSDFVGDDAVLLISCKRILDRQPSAAPLVWLVAHALGAPNPVSALWQAAEEIEDDKTHAAVGYELPDDASIAVIGWSDWLEGLLRSRGDLSLVVIDIDGEAEFELEQSVDPDQHWICVDPSGAGQALGEATHVLLGLDALGPELSIARQGALSLAATAKQRGLPVWAVAPTGVALPDRMYGGLARRWHESEHAPIWERAVEEIETRLFDRVATHRGVVGAEDAMRMSGCPIVPELF